MVMGEGKNPTQDHLLRLADTCSIRRDKALEILHQVLAATEKWGQFASDTGVSKLQTKNIGEALSLIRKKVC